MTEPLNMNISHIAICTSDLERSARFYTEALGFTHEYYVDFAEPFEILMEVPQVKGRVGLFHRGNFRLELCSYQQPGVHGAPERRPMNQVGLSHVSLVVDDLDAVSERIVALGGRVYPETRMSAPAGDLVFCTDPDGVRLELWRKPK
jgi:lactoylglutathione lyase